MSGEVDRGVGQGCGIGMGLGLFLLAIAVLPFIVCFIGCAVMCITIETGKALHEQPKPITGPEKPPNRR